MKFRSSSVEEHADVPVADDGQLDQIVARFRALDADRSPSSDSGNASYVVAIASRGHRAEARLAELTSLVSSQGDDVVGSEIAVVRSVNARMLLGRGTAEEVGQRATAAGANMLVIDAELTPSQTRNLEDATGFAVCDREAVILNVFSRNARTRRARIQIEIAHLEYLRPRIRGIGLDMDQQAGGVIGGRGSGETASELLARQLDGRLAVLRASARRLSDRARGQRKGRSGCARIALVGYTNAGKTSLMNALTGAGLSAADRPFETLDTTARALSRHGGDVILSDTVGFIRDLPERLLESFESTLAEVNEASLVAIVVDCSDPEWPLHVRTTKSVLDRLGAGDIAALVVFNKADRVEAAAHADIVAELAPNTPYLFTSAHSPAPVAELRAALLQAARADHVLARVFVPYEAKAAIAMAYARCRVISAQSVERGIVFDVEAEPHVIEALRSSRKEVDAC